MTRLTNALYPQTINGTNEKTLDDLYRFLHPTVSRWVYFSNIPAFHGQENDLIQDIIQETIFRFTLYSQETYVFFPERMALVIAKHFFLDLTRKESRMEHSIPETFPNEKHDFSEEAVNNVYQGQVFTVLAKEIASFPHGQKTALLVDLAWRTDVEDKVGPLQGAFLKVGIDLKAYRLPTALDTKKRSQHASLLNQAYRRLLKSYAVQQLLADL